MKYCDLNQENIEKVRSGELLEEFIIDNLTFVRFVVNRVLKTTARSLSIDMEDLMQEGIIELTNCLMTFDCKKGYKFSTYAFKNMYYAIKRTMIHDAVAINHTSYFYNNYRQYIIKKDELLKNIGHKVTCNELSKLLNIPLELVFKYENYLHLSKSLDNLDSKRNLDYENAYNGNPEEIVLNNSYRDFLIKKIDTIGGKKAFILKERFGFNDGDVKTLDSIGKKLSLTRERVRQLQNEGLKQLSNYPLK